MWLPPPLTRLRGAILIAVVALACSESNFEPEGAQRFAPPSIYLDWWAQIESCTGVQADFHRVVWYRVDRLVNLETGRTHAGAWQPPHNIYLERGHLLNSYVVTHEMVHELLQRLDHGSPLFERCSRAVTGRQAIAVP